MNPQTNRLAREETLLSGHSIVTGSRGPGRPPKPSKARKGMATSGNDNRTGRIRWSCLALSTKILRLGNRQRASLLKTPESINRENTSEQLAKSHQSNSRNHRKVTLLKWPGLARKRLGPHFSDDILNNIRNLLGIDFPRFPHLTTTNGFIGKPFVRQKALQLPAKFFQGI